MSVELIKSQLPSFVTEEYPQFVVFLEKYYEFFQSIQKRVEIAKDASDTFLLDELVSELAANVPAISKLTEDQKRLIIQKLSDLYKSKGSEESIRGLISILYGIESEIFLPSSQIFKSSAATWNRDFSIRFELQSGLLNSFENVQATLTNSSRTIEIDIAKILKLDGTSNIFECFIAGNYNLVINEPTTIQTDSFTGTLVKSVVGKTILNRGIGYSVGDIFDVDEFGTRIKVTKTTEESGLKSFEIIRYGNGYTTDFEINIQSNSLIAQLLQPDLTIQQLNSISEMYNETKVETDNSVNNIIERLLITRFNYIDNADYFVDNTYVGELLRDSTFTTESSQIENNFSARVAFKLGYVFIYPGYYSTNVGFLSDTSYLQDGNYYQQFSYVIKSRRQFSEYSEAVRNLVHPAGFKMFGEYNITNELNILVDVINRLSVLDFNLIEFVEADDFVVKIVMKSIEENAIAADALFKQYQKMEADSFNVSDTVFKTFSKAVTDLQQATDTLEKQVQKVVFDVANLTDIVTKTVSKALPDEAMVPDEGCAILNGYYLASEVATYSGTYWKCGYAVNETYFGSDVFLSTGDGDVLAANSTDEFIING